jgi:hypothetical protein
MEWSYWKVVLKYGHVGKGKEVSVARFLAVPSHFTLLEVKDIAENMPGTKHRAATSIIRIDQYSYLIGKREETENFFLQKLNSQKHEMIK